MNWKCRVCGCETYVVRRENPNIYGPSSNLGPIIGISCAECDIEYATIPPTDPAGDMEKLKQLIAAITDKMPDRQEFDEAKFNEAIEREIEECKRRYKEYCDGHRWATMPGGL